MPVLAALGALAPSSGLQGSLRICVHTHMRCTRIQINTNGKIVFKRLRIAEDSPSPPTQGLSRPI